MKIWKTIQEWTADVSDRGGHELCVQLAMDGHVVVTAGFGSVPIIEAAEETALAFVLDRITQKKDIGRLTAMCIWSDGRRFGPLRVGVKVITSVENPRQGFDQED